MFRELRISAGLFLLLLLVTGLGYPLLVLGIGQGAFPEQANGSLIEANGKIIGSSLIGQNFSRAIYFHPRPSAAGNGYDAANSSGSNLGPTSADLLKAVGDRVAALKAGNGVVMQIPVDLVTASGSGLDPDISPAAAEAQIARVAAARHMDPAALKDLVARMTEPPAFGLFGDRRVNVLELNQALDKAPPQ